MTTDEAHRAHPRQVTASRLLLSSGTARREIAKEVSSGRWRRAGLAVVMHNGPLSTDQRHRVALVHAGPQSLLTGFTVASLHGLRGWERPESHVLAPSGTRLRAGCPVPVRLQLCSRAPRRQAGRPMELLTDSLLRAAATFVSDRPACGILAASVQQGLCTADELRAALTRSTRVRHRRSMLLAIADIAGGADALSEIDFVRLCRRHGHLAVTRWWDDQDRQNELAITDVMVLRFPTVAVRSNEARVVDQLRRALRV